MFQQTEIHRATIRDIECVATPFLKTLRSVLLLLLAREEKASHSSVPGKRQEYQERLRWRFLSIPCYFGANRHRWPHPPPEGAPSNSF